MIGHRVIVLDVIMDPDLTFLRFRKNLGFGRQRLDGGPRQLLERRGAVRRKMPRGVIVQRRHAVTDRHVQNR
jgi:hypothetical protein